MADSRLSRMSSSLHELQTISISLHVGAPLKSEMLGRQSVCSFPKEMNCVCHAALVWIRLIAWTDEVMS